MTNAEPLLGDGSIYIDDHIPGSICLIVVLLQGLCAYNRHCSGEQTMVVPGPATDRAVYYLFVLCLAICHPCWPAEIEPLTRPPQSL
jgi:hypothetical protein